MPGMGSAQALLECRDASLGPAGLSHRRYRLPRLQEASHRAGGPGSHRHAPARPGVRGKPGPRARHHRRRLREGAQRREPDAGRREAGDGTRVSLRSHMNKPDLKLVEGGVGGARAEPHREPSPEQAEMPFAMVDGEAVMQLPHDLYIPPDALQVFLEAFEGPLDLLLYLIRRQNLDILDIPIAEISRQYVQYIELMKEMQFELAGEYLVMAATLAEIKSRMLLPRSGEEEEEDDPRAELVRRLQ